MPRTSRKIQGQIQGAYNMLPSAFCICILLFLHKAPPYAAFKEERDGSCCLASILTEHSIWSSSSLDTNFWVQIQSVSRIFLEQQGKRTGTADGLLARFTLPATKKYRRFNRIYWKVSRSKIKQKILNFSRKLHKFCRKH